MKSICTILLAFTMVTAYSQISGFRIKAGVNTGFVGSYSTPLKLNTYTPSPGYYSSSPNLWSLKYTYEAKPGFEAGAAFDYPLGKRFYITSGLDVSLIRYKSVAKAKNISMADPIVGSDLYGGIVGTPFGAIQAGRDLDHERIPDSPSIRIEDDNENKLGNTSLVFINVPLLIGTNILKDKAFVRAGLTGSFIAHASTWQWRQTLSRYSIERDNNAADNFNRISASATLQAGLNITSNLALQLSGQYFVRPLYKEGDQRMTTASAGLVYKL